MVLPFHHIHWYSKCPRVLCKIYKLKNTMPTVRQLAKQSFLFLPLHSPKTLSVQGQENWFKLTGSHYSPTTFETQPKPNRRLWQTGSVTVCSSIQEGILYFSQCSLERSSSKKTTNNEQTHPSVHQSLTRPLKCQVHWL